MYNVAIRLTLATIAAVTAMAVVPVLAPVTAPTTWAEGTAVEEDDSAWDCRTMGNQVCGPGQGEVAGQYAEGRLIPWPHNDIPVWCRDICLGA